MINTSASEKVYKNALDSLYDGVAIFDSDGNPVYVNQAHLSQIGINMDTWYATNLRDSPTLSLTISGSPISLSVLEEKKAHSGLAHYIKTEKTCLVSSSLVYTEGNKFLIVSVVRDLTELLELQQKVRTLDVLKDTYARKLREF